MQLSLYCQDIVKVNFRTNVRLQIIRHYFHCRWQHWILGLCPNFGGSHIITNDLTCNPIPKFVFFWRRRVPNLICLSLCIHFRSRIHLDWRYNCNLAYQSKVINGRQKSYLGSLMATGGYFNLVIKVFWGSISGN